MAFKYDDGARVDYHPDPAYPYNRGYKYTAQIHLLSPEKNKPPYTVQIHCYNARKDSSLHDYNKSFSINFETKQQALDLMADLYDPYNIEYAIDMVAKMIKTGLDNN